MPLSRIERQLMGIGVAFLPKPGRNPNTFMGEAVAKKIADLGNLSRHTQAHCVDRLHPYCRGPVGHQPQDKRFGDAPRPWQSASRGTSGNLGVCQCSRGGLLQIRRTACEPWAHFFNDWEKSGTKRCLWWGWTLATRIWSWRWVCQAVSTTI